MIERRYQVLFLCTGNSARSILAESILNRVGVGRFNAFSAGSRPTGEVHPYTLELLESLDYPTRALRSKSWDEFALPNATPLDFVVTVCDSAAGEACPVWPGRPITAHWGVPDPATLDGGETERRLAFSEAYRILGSRIVAFANLPIGSLDRPTLQAALEAAGRTTGDRIATASET